MENKMTRAEAKAWKERWERVNAYEIEELRRTPVELKLQQLATLMASVDDFGWRAALESEVEQVRHRWQELRKAYGSQVQST